MVGGWYGVEVIWGTWGANGELQTSKYPQIPQKELAMRNNTPKSTKIHQNTQNIYNGMPNTRNKQYPKYIKG